MRALIRNAAAAAASLGFALLVGVGPVSAGEMKSGEAKPSKPAAAMADDPDKGQMSKPKSTETKERAAAEQERRKSRPERRRPRSY